MKALPVLATKIAKQGGLLLGLNSFGYESEIQILGQVHNGSYDHQRICTVVHALNERPIDLQRIER